MHGSRHPIIRPRLNGWMRVFAALIALMMAGGSTLLAHDVPDAARKVAKEQGVPWAR